MRLENYFKMDFYAQYLSTEICFFNFLKPLNPFLFKDALQIQEKQSQFKTFPHTRPNHNAKNLKFGTHDLPTKDYPFYSFVLV